MDIDQEPGEDRSSSSGEGRTSLPASEQASRTHFTERQGALADGPQRAAPPDGYAEDPQAQPEGEDSESTDSFSQFIRGTRTAVEDADDVSASILPRQPRTLLDVGLSKALLTDLALKIIHYSGTPSLAQLTRRLGLGPAVVQLVITALSEERLIEVMSQSDLYTGNYRYRLTERGIARVSQALDRSRYAGPAPVTAEQYTDVMRHLHAHKQEFSRSRIKGILGDLVLTTEVADSVARALFSGKAVLFYGPSGNGKTSILERYAHELDGMSLVPYAIYAYGQTIRVYDPSIHQALDEPEESEVVKDESKMDRRWVLVRRPAVVLGAEMGREWLDMAYDPQARFYQAPPHIKAQGGVLIIDDFGRQKVEARELLTRLLIPLERGWDTLSLATGEKLNLPFSMQLLFGTNIAIKSLADEALLRRILYKVEIPNPEPQEFTEIMRQLCRHKHVLVAEGVLEHVVDTLYNSPGLKPRASHARDLLDMLIEGASFDGREPVLDVESFDRIFRLFVSQEAREDEDTSR